MGSVDAYIDGSLVLSTNVDEDLTELGVPMALLTETAAD